MTEKTVNYTEEMVKELVELYQHHGNEGLDEIAQKLNRSVRSIRSKLVREGVYVAQPKGTTMKRDNSPTKKELLNQLEAVIGFDVTPLTGSTKEGLQKLIEFAQSKAS